MNTESLIKNIHKFESDIEGINSSLETIKNNKALDNDIIIFASYQRGRFDSSKDFTIYVGDNEKCNAVNTEPLLTFTTNKPLWDISLFYNDGKYYFIGDYKSSDSVWGGDSFLLIETTDFKEFKQTSFQVRSAQKNITQTWAPKIFKDGDKIYLVYCIQENNEKYTDTNLLNTQHEKLKMCYSEALDNTLTSWSEPVYFNVGNNDCIIDPFIVKKDSIYHLFGCYDNDAKIYHYTSTSMSGAFTHAGTVPFPNITEAPSVVFYNNKYYMFVDSHRATGGRDSGLIQVMESVDLATWTNLKTYNNTGKEKMRHFAPIVVTGVEKNKINDAFKSNNLNNNYIDSNENIKTSASKNDISYFNIASITPSVTKTIDELYVMPNTIYYKNSSVGDIDINKINASKLKNFDTFSFVLNSFGNDKITIKNNSDKGSFLPNRSDLIIDGSVGSVIHTFTVLDGYIKAITPLKYSPVIKGVGIANSNYIVSTSPDFECKYIISGKTCVVSYIFKFSSIIPSLGVVVSGLPLPEMGVIFSSTLNETNDYNKYSTFKINDDGTIIEWYGFKPIVGSVLKGSFTYICK